MRFKKTVSAWIIFSLLPAYSASAVEWTTLRSSQLETTAGLEELEEALGKPADAENRHWRWDPHLDALLKEVAGRPVWEAMTGWYHQWAHTEEVTSVVSLAAANAQLPESLRALLTATALVHDYTGNPQEPRTEETIAYVWSEKGFRELLLNIGQARGIASEFSESLVNHWIRLLDFDISRPRPDPIALTQDWIEQHRDQWPSDWLEEQLILASQILWVADVSALYITPTLSGKEIVERLEGLDLEKGLPKGTIAKGTANFFQSFVTSPLTAPLYGDEPSLLDLLDNGSFGPHHGAWESCLVLFVPTAGLEEPISSGQEIQIQRLAAAIERYL